MSARSVQLRDDAETLFQIDALSRGLHVANITQQLMHRKGLFVATVVSKGLTNGVSVDFLVRAGLKTLHMGYTATSSGTGDLKTFEGPTTTADGTPVPIRNRNRLSPVGTIGATMFMNPTVSVDGTVILDELVPPGGVRRVEGLLADELIIAPGAQCLIRVLNTSGGNIAISLILDLFESDLT